MPAGSLLDAKQEKYQGQAFKLFVSQPTISREAEKKLCREA
jgi:hypothetical protein